MKATRVQHRKTDKRRSLKKKLRAMHERTFIVPGLWSQWDAHCAVVQGWVLVYHRSQYGADDWRIARATNRQYTFKFRSDEDARVFVDKLADEGNGRATRALQALAWAQLTGLVP